MTPGDRVRFVDPVYGDELGTVEHVSPAGYVRVVWDSDGTVGNFSPVLAAESLLVLTGDAALPRHAWNDADICGRCKVSYTADREAEPCRA